ncbi:DUF4192 domain-containing protein [Actinokineospora sp. PR83]|uniref:DUF4192 domain-containing protein n=1 Tax=Actinokineospora sp. PR83 TaxID=2884908 RepID=UPI001F22EA8C|nr:DUF4192 domain-containing protein [Actinokineospora sp. PR83]MCG8918040.1 DUF4192 domain-containing protein [Actinokineospora sp. PR83]
MTPTPLRTTLALHDGGDLVAAVPNLLGFHPVDSLVLITVVERPGGGDAAIGTAIRADLPAPEDYGGMAEHLAEIATGHSASAAFLVLVGGERLARKDLVRRVVDNLEAVSVTVPHALWAPATAEGQPWWCYADCACTGKVVDPDTSALAVAMTVAGAVRYPDRQSLADTLTQDPRVDLARRAALIRSATTPPDPSLVDETISEMAAAGASDPPAPEPALDDDLVAGLAIALSDADIRGHCLTIALTERAGVAERLWTRLVRMLPDPHRSVPACLLAVHAYLRGDGALAQMALELANAADSDNNLAALLRACLERALPPDEFRDMLTRSIG